MLGCQAPDNADGLSGRINLPRVLDMSMAYQTEPFTRTIEDVRLFKGEAPCILITHNSEVNPLANWRTQILLIAKAGPGEVTYDMITINGLNGYDNESGG